MSFCGGWNQAKLGIPCPMSVDYGEAFGPPMPPQQVPTKAQKTAMMDKQKLLWLGISLVATVVVMKVFK